MAHRDRGARSAFDDDGGKKRGGLPWWLLALLALLALLLLLLLLRSCGGDEEPKSSGTTTPPAQTPPAEERTPPPADGGAGGEAGRLTAGGTQILPANGDQDLEQYIEQEARGERIRVQEVVQDEGFFVGTSQQDRVYVEFGGDVGENEANAASFTPKVGDEVNLTGPVRPSPAEPEQTLNLDPEDAEQVRKQGIYVNADTVKPAK